MIRGAFIGAPNLARPEPTPNKDLLVWTSHIAGIINLCRYVAELDVLTASKLFSNEIFERKKHRKVAQLRSGYL